ncbi:MAG: hypothetical protein LBG17_04100 [Bacteroidales bacterium]|jgi:hypothetical protein|nr:hypothetical protein [Bacteroidales bacterium]
MKKLSVVLLFLYVANILSAQTQTRSISEQEYQLLLKRIEALEEKQPIADTSKKKKRAGKFVIGGYGEAVTHRFFYSDDFRRYSYPENYKDAKSRGQFDLPHVVFMLGYEFPKGWKFGAEIEFEHGGTESAIEIEGEEFGEYESEIERGGEVALEQFWLEKSFNDAVNIRLGHIIVPIGLTNAYHLPTEYLSVLRQEEETTVMPSTWHETGISFWGKKNNWRYEVLFIAGLNADQFSDANWVKGASASPYEFKLANAYAGAFRIDNYSVKGLRLGLSGYYGHSAANSLKSERYKGLKGAVIIGTFDFEYKAHNFWLLGNMDYGHLTDASEISRINKNMQTTSPSPRTNVASDALSGSFYMGYDFFGLSKKLQEKDMKFYVFGHCGYVNSMFKTTKNILADKRFEKVIASAGINYYPIKDIVIKLEYQSRLFPETVYNTENTISLGIMYSGLFKF